MHLTVKSALLALGVVQGFFLAGFLIAPRQRRPRANVIFGLFIFAFSLLSLGDILLDTKSVSLFPETLFVFAPLVFALAPLGFLYVIAVTDPSWRFTGVHALHFLPVMLGYVLLLPALFAPQDLKLSMVAEAYASGDHPLDFIMLAAMTQIAVYLVLSARLLHLHVRRVDQYFSSLERVNLRWLNLFLVLNVVLGIAFAVATLFRLQVLIDISDLLFPLLVYVTGYAGLHQPEIFTRRIDQDLLDEVAKLPRKKYASSSITGEESGAIAARLLSVMATERLYLRGDLTLPDLADVAGFPLHRVSQVINEQFRMTFNSFVNGYRVEEFKTRLEDPRYAHLTILAIGFDAGFNSKAAMNRAFKIREGISPSDYRVGRGRTGGKSSEEELS